jgi:hypothetical protein
VRVERMGSHRARKRREISAGAQNLDRCHDLLSARTRGWHAGECRLWSPAGKPPLSATAGFGVGEARPAVDHTRGFLPSWAFRSDFKAAVAEAVRY